MARARGDQYDGQPDWWVTWTFANNTLTETGAGDAQVTRAGAGDYIVEIGAGGIDAHHRTVRVDFVVVGGTMSSHQVDDIDDTHKEILFKDAAGNPVDPARVAVAIDRLIGL
jgi:hypothetical protein